MIQALLALVLLAGRRIGLRGELPFGPAMLLGAAVAIGWSDALLRLSREVVTQRDPWRPSAPIRGRRADPPGG